MHELWEENVFMQDVNLITMKCCFARVMEYSCFDLCLS